MDGFTYDRISPEDFSDKLRAAGMNLNDFLYLTGRRAFDVRTFLGVIPSRTARYQPTMGDVILLELAADKRTKARMEEIAAGYVTGELNRRK